MDRQYRTETERDRSRQRNRQEDRQRPTEQRPKGDAGRQADRQTDRPAVSRIKPQTSKRLAQLWTYAHAYPLWPRLRISPRIPSRMPTHRGRT
jgi:hypothetical protein